MKTIFIIDDYLGILSKEIIEAVSRRYINVTIVKKLNLRSKNRFRSTIDLVSLREDINLQSLVIVFARDARHAASQICRIVRFINPENATVLAPIFHVINYRSNEFSVAEIIEKFETREFARYSSIFESKQISITAIGEDFYSSSSRLPLDRSAAILSDLISNAITMHLVGIGILQDKFSRKDVNNDPCGRTVHILAAISDLDAGTNYREMIVRVPENHKIGRVEKPKNYSFFSFKRWTDPSSESDFFQFSGQREISEQELLETVDNNNKSSGLVFVHGYNNDLEDAAFRLSQIVFDTQYDGQAFLFSWPSDNTEVGYFSDRDTIEFAKYAFLDFLDALDGRTNLQEINVVAHSMGCRLAMSALGSPRAIHSYETINELILAHPDIHGPLFYYLLRSYSLCSDSSVTIYSSSQDWPIRLSRFLSKARPFSLSDWLEIRQLLSVEPIDISALSPKLTKLNHSTFAEHRSLIDDIGRLITDGVHPPNVRSPQIRPVRLENMEIPAYWRFVE